MSVALTRFLATSQKRSLVLLVGRPFKAGSFPVERRRPIWHSTWFYEPMNTSKSFNHSRDSYRDKTLDSSSSDSSTSSVKPVNKSFGEESVPSLKDLGSLPLLRAPIKRSLLDSVTNSERNLDPTDSASPTSPELRRSQRARKQVTHFQYDKVLEREKLQKQQHQESKPQQSSGSFFGNFIAGATNAIAAVVSEVTVNPDNQVDNPRKQVEEDESTSSSSEDNVFKTPGPLNRNISEEDEEDSPDKQGTSLRLQLDESTLLGQSPEFKPTSVAKLEPKLEDIKTEVTDSDFLSASQAFNHILLESSSTSSPKPSAADCQLIKMATNTSQVDIQKVRSAFGVSDLRKALDPVTLAAQDLEDAERILQQQLKDLDQYDKIHYVGLDFHLFLE